MNIMALALFFAVVYWLAIAEAHDDHGQIRRHEKIDHFRQWIFRAVIVGGAAFILCAFTPISFLPLWGAGGFLFSALFRWKLNKLRGLDWRYIAPWSNYYDRLFYRVWNGFVWNLWHWPSRQNIEAAMRMYTTGWEESIKDIHRAGLLAYIVEAITSIVCIVWAVV